MKQFLLLVFISVSSSLYSQSTQQPELIDSFPNTFNYNRDFRKLKTLTEDRKSDYFYQKLLIRYLDHDSSLTYPEMLVLMIGFTDHNNYKPLENLETEKEIIELNDHGYFQDAIEECKKYLRKNPFSLSANKEMSYAYHKIGLTDSAKYFMHRNDMIMEAMIFSGGKKGRTPETAFFSLGLNDGDYFIPNVGLSPTNSSVKKDKFKNTIYVIDAMNIESAVISYYFNIQHAKIKSDNDGIAEKKKSKLDKARKKRAASKKGKKGKSNEETEETNNETTDEADNESNPPALDDIPKTQPVEPTNLDTIPPTPSENQPAVPENTETKDIPSNPPSGKINSPFIESFLARLTIKHQTISTV